MTNPRNGHDATKFRLRKDVKHRSIGQGQVHFHQYSSKMC